MTKLWMTNVIYKLYNKNKAERCKLKDSNCYIRRTSIILSHKLPCTYKKSLLKNIIPHITNQLDRILEKNIYIYYWILPQNIRLITEPIVITQCNAQMNMQAIHASNYLHMNIRNLMVKALAATNKSTYDCWFTELNSQKIFAKSWIQPV